MRKQKINPNLKKTISLMFIIQITYFSVFKKPKIIHIMSIGDSITDGVKIKGAYRKYLYYSLKKSGYLIRMIGPKSSNKFAYFKDQNKIFSYETSHCGYSGYTIKTNKERKGIMNIIQKKNYLSRYKPDIIILMIGTNDVMINIDIETIINNLKDFLLYIKNKIKNNSLIFVTSIPPMNPNTKIVYNWFENYRKDKDITDIEVKTIVEKNIVDYNNAIKELVNNLKNDGINIYFSDLSSVLNDADTFCYDGVHPNEKAHKLIGDYLYKQLYLILKEFNKF